MIISASRRTDIPAFYGQWLFSCLQAGEVAVRNPVNPKQTSRFSLLPEDVDALVFWTKNPAPMFDLLPEIDAMGYFYYFLFTLTPYDSLIEPGVPAKSQRIDVFLRLSDMIGPEKVVWRYDPVIMTDAMNHEWHTTAFRSISGQLAGSTGRCIVSFLDDYRKIRTRMRKIDYFLPDRHAMAALACDFSSIAHHNGMDLFTCGHAEDLSHCGILHGSCIDRNLIARLSGRSPKSNAKDRGQRRHCGCAVSRDIGEYDTCRHGCLYCYAMGSG
ncbi:MAG: DUF1848 domain-containing protein [Chlorobium sp.]|uniref:DUF1848 domain-containing protein n=1 Tax=Chlorobium sp. TaxID=1095 RepID=UPI0025C009C3|nr:DUF1848 domain-containing protein [Chlorobium sp.]MCF8215970.1 DUF1848 domain-containing protein [Chlorobium sp.]MCF8270479.1 DUF1848 domain-containing protein [Chlorobium sp.]MCF8287245.1 DUF1848 domain-containing protein [Chlorobium sp.]MCF8290447.1 DUF1848 domain-containing protein [Chlorobium sp.]MCF8384681.1 DUF1848 domain-containing protein [Chlorobium sp.]